MVKVTFLTKQGMTISMSISGHAGFAASGKDLVCAGASTIAFGLLNVFAEKNPTTNCTVLENQILIEDNNPSELTQHLFDVGLIQFQTLQEAYPKYLQINIQEVKV